MYGEFAVVYDQLMADVDYDAWAAHYRTLLSARGVPEGAVVLEPACGTGSLTLRLARHYTVLPSDASEEMLSVAAKKSKAAGLSLTFIRQELRQLHAHCPADAVVCACDGVNYLLTDAALLGFLRSAYAALKPGGVLAFDVSSFDKLSRVLGSQPQVFRSNDLCYLWENAWNQRGSKLSLSLSVFIREEEGTYRRIDEEQVQRGWAEETLCTALTSAGFCGIQCYGNHTMSRPAVNAQRLHITAIRK